MLFVPTSKNATKYNATSSTYKIVCSEEIIIVLFHFYFVYIYMYGLLSVTVLVHVHLYKYIILDIVLRFSFLLAYLT
jgi:hypothetical protein